VLNEPLPLDFTAILRNALLRHMSHKATCQTCKHFSNFSSRRSIASRDLPPILAVNASVYTPESLSYWLDNRGQTFLKSQIELHGQVEGIDDPESAVYALRVCISPVLRSPSLIFVPVSCCTNCDEGEELTFGCHCHRCRLSLWFLRHCS
jgi:hypothetical protein